MSTDPARRTIQLHGTHNTYRRNRNDSQTDYKDLSNQSMRQTYNDLLQKRNDSFSDNNTTNTTNTINSNNKNVNYNQLSSQNNNNNNNSHLSSYSGRFNNTSTHTINYNDDINDYGTRNLDHSSTYSKFKKSIYNDRNDKDSNNILMDDEDDDDDEEYIDYNNEHFKDDEIDYLDHTSDENITDEYSEFESDTEKDSEYLNNIDDDIDDLDDSNLDELQNNNSNDYLIYDNEKNKKSFINWKNILITILIMTIFTYFVKIGENPSTLISTDNNNNNDENYLFNDGKENSVTNMQKQINHLYNELSNRDTIRNIEFDDKIKLIINQFEKNIRKLIPSNILNFQKQLDNLYGKIDFIEKKTKKNNSNLFYINNVTSLQEQLITELENNLPTQIPVMINNSSKFLMIPELHTYLSSLVSNIIKYSQSNNETSTYSIDNFNTTLNYDLNDYIKEILTNELQYVDKTSFINEINQRLQENKFEILEELKTNIQNEISKANLNLENDKYQNNNQNTNNNLSKRYSTILLKKLINHIYNTNQYQWEDDLDFATFAQGTRLLKSLTSSNYDKGNGVTSLELLSDIKLAASSTYWQCPVSSTGCSLAFRFNKPIYLIKVSYLHGRFINNLHMMNSAPKRISIFVKLNNKLENTKLLEIAKSYNQGDLFYKDQSFIKIGEHHYDLLDKKIKQQFSLPMWFIQAKPLVKSIIFNIDENFGNEEYISARKFIINAVTQDDLQILKSNSFALAKGNDNYDTDQYDTFEDNIPHYHADEMANRLVTHHITNNINNDSKNNENRDNRRIPAFGQDEIVQ